MWGWRKCSDIKPRGTPETPASAVLDMDTHSTAAQQHTYQSPGLGERGQEVRAWRPSSGISFHTGKGKPDAAKLSTGRCATEESSWVRLDWGKKIRSGRELRLQLSGFKFQLFQIEAMGL